MKRAILLFTLLTTFNNNIIGYCDIKGNVNNSGVYEVRKNETINDIVKKAGGLKKNSYTDNINLSKLVTDEMVIYIHSISEIERQKELNSCKCEPVIKYIECNDLPSEITTTQIIKPFEETTTTSKIIETTTSVTTTKKQKEKININEAPLEELMELNGLGESKAKKIIDYRNKVGKFESIDDLLKVDGIGAKTFDNIKEYIEI